LAEALMRKGNSAEALDKIGQALKRESSYVPAYVTMGDIYMADSQVDKALEAYSRALNIDPKNFETRVKRAKLYMDRNNYRDAVADLEQAAKVNPYRGEVYLLSSQCYKNLGDNEKARQDAWKARVFADR